MDVAVRFDARPIIKGRFGTPVEFGYKAQIADNADGLVVDYDLHAGNPPDAPLLAPAIDRIARRVGKVPRAVTADRGYAEAGVAYDLTELGRGHHRDSAQVQTHGRPTRDLAAAIVPAAAQVAHRPGPTENPPATLTTRLRGDGMHSQLPRQRLAGVQPDQGFFRSKGL